MKKLKLMTIIGTRPEIIRLSAVIKKCDKYFDQILVHTGQNYDYTLNQIFFEDLGLRAPDFYLDAVGQDLGETIGNIIAKSYALMVEAEARCAADPGRHQQLPFGHRGQAAAHPDLPYGGRQPLL